MSQQSRIRPWCPNGHSPIRQFEIGPFRNFVYLIIDWATKQALWVDPQADLSEPFHYMRSEGLRLVGVCLTHTHHDHTAGLAELLRLNPKLPVYLHESDAHRLNTSSFQDHLHFLEDGHHLQLGKLFVQAFHTPGHSAGALTYLVEDCLITGDTLFIRDCGRTDLPTGSTDQMFHTLQRYKKMPAELKIFPGHHYQEECWSTLEDELRTSPPLQCTSPAQLEALP